MAIAVTVAIGVGIIIGLPLYKWWLMIYEKMT